MRDLWLGISTCKGHSDVSINQRVCDSENLQDNYKYFGKEVNNVLKKARITRKFIKDDEFVFLFKY